MHVVRIEFHDADGWHLLEANLTDNIGRAFEIFEVSLAVSVTADALRVVSLPGSEGASFTAVDGLTHEEDARAR